MTVVLDWGEIICCLSNQKNELDFKSHVNSRARVFADDHSLHFKAFMISFNTLNINQDQQ